jgi:hypothetical protein
LTGAVSVRPSRFINVKMENDASLSLKEAFMRPHQKLGWRIGLVLYLRSGRPACDYRWKLVVPPFSYEEERFMASINDYQGGYGPEFQKLLDSVTQ